MRIDFYLTLLTNASSAELGLINDSAFYIVMELVNRNNLVLGFLILGSAINVLNATTEIFNEFSNWHQR